MNLGLSKARFVDAVLSVVVFNLKCKNESGMSERGIGEPSADTPSREGENPIEHMPGDSEGPPLPPWRAQLSLWLGLCGMILYTFALHMTTYFHAPVQSRFGSQALLASYSWSAQFFAPLGCASFIGAILISFRVRYFTLLLMVFIASILIGLAVSGWK